MQEWYRRFYRATRTSRAYSRFCQRVYGRDYSQHGFVNMAQLDRLLDRLRLAPGTRVLEAGCGAGGVAEYIADRTGAQVHGIDYIPEAIERALERTEGKRDRLTFEVADLATAELPTGRYDLVLCLDSLYFTDLTDTLRRLAAGLAPQGRMGLYYVHILWDGQEHLRPTLTADGGPVAEALRRNGLCFTAEDLTEEDYRHALLAAQVLEELRPEFEAEGTLFLYENRRVEALGQRRFYEQGRTARYLYVASRGLGCGL